jgi:hypothetical protein
VFRYIYRFEINTTFDNVGVGCYNVVLPVGSASAADIIIFSKLPETFT